MGTPIAELPYKVEGTTYFHLIKQRTFDFDFDGNKLGYYEGTRNEGDFRKPMDCCFIITEKEHIAKYIMTASERVDHDFIMRPFSCVYDKKLLHYVIAFPLFKDMDVLSQKDLKESNLKYRDADRQIWNMFKNPRVTWKGYDGVYDLSNVLKTQLKGLSSGFRCMFENDCESTWMKNPLGLVYCIKSKKIKILLMDRIKIYDREVAFESFHDKVKSIFFMDQVEWPARDHYLDCILDTDFPDTDEIPRIRLKLITEHPLLEFDKRNVLEYISEVVLQSKGKRTKAVKSFLREACGSKFTDSFLDKESGSGWVKKWGPYFKDVYERKDVTKARKDDTKATESESVRYDPLNIKHLFRFLRNICQHYHDIRNIIINAVEIYNEMEYHFPRLAGMIYREAYNASLLFREAEAEAVAGGMTYSERRHTKLSS